MKKGAIFAGLLLASAVVGGSAAYFVVSGVNASKGSGTGSVAAVERPLGESAGSHFTAYAAQEYPDLTYPAENAVEAVVNIEVTQMVAGGQSVDPFYEFFGIPQGSQSPRERRGGGSGVIIGTDGYIVTNHHVVENATELKVKLYDGRTFSAEVVGSDPTTEVALIKIEASELPTLVFGDSDALRLGEWVLAIGSPFDLQSTITAGIVSAKSRNLGSIPDQYRVESFIQTDAAVNPGNSGGALVNTRGELVGINTLIKTQTGTYIGYSFAIPSSIVKKVVVDLKEYGVVQRALLGVTYQEINQEFLERFGEEYGIDETGGVRVASVTPDGAAEAAGIREGDIITSVDGVAIEGNANLSEIMSKYRPNDKVTVLAKRGDRMKQFVVTLRNKAGKAELLSRDYVDAVEALGGRFSDVDTKTLKALGVDHGIRVTEVRKGGILARARVRRGFVITHINERPVRKVADLGRITEPITYIDGVYPDGRGASYSLVQ